MRRIASSLVIAVLLLSMFVFAFNVQTARAQGIININPNGKITSPAGITANITNSGNVTYTFTGNNYLPIVVNRSNIIINGMGHTLQAPGGTGFSLTAVSNVTIKNTTVTNSQRGVWLDSSSSNVVSGNTVTANSLQGVWLDSSSGNVVSGNSVTANSEWGIWLGYYSDNNTLSGNNVTANSNDGIDLYNSSGNVLSGNNVRANSGYGIYLYSSGNDTLSGNNVTANILSGICLGFSSGNVLSGNNLTANRDDGVQLYSSSDNNTLSGNNVTANSLGIVLDSSSGNVLSGNVMASSLWNFGVGGSVLSDFVNNVSTSNLVDGKPVYYLMNRSNIVISPETCPEGVGYLGLVNCRNVTVQGLTLASNGEGLLLTNTNDSKITGNNVTANIYGICCLDSSGNIVSGNNITANGFGINGDGIVLESSSDNTFFHNNFINNTYQVLSDGSPNTWDDGYPSGGNYWSDYRTAYPNAAEVDSSAIWNTSYVIDSNNIDRYPLMAPFETFSVGTWNGTAYSIDTISNSTITNLSFNATAKTLTFNVTGTSGTAGFCRVTIPIALMSGSWTVTVNGTKPQNVNVTIYGNYTYVYFTYHHSTEMVQITSTNAVPEFQPFMLLSLLMMITLLTAIASKRNRKVAHVTRLAKG